MNVDIAWRLEGEGLPAVTLPATDGGAVALAALRGHWSVLFTYVKNFKDMPGVVPPADWFEIPGAAG